MTEPTNISATLTAPAAWRYAARYNREVPSTRPANWIRFPLATDMRNHSLGLGLSEEGRTLTRFPPSLEVRLSLRCSGSCREGTPQIAYLRRSRTGLVSYNLLQEFIRHIL